MSVQTFLFRAFSFRLPLLSLILLVPPSTSPPPSLPSAHRTAIHHKRFNASNHDRRFRMHIIGTNPRGTNPRRLFFHDTLKKKRGGKFRLLLPNLFVAYCILLISIASIIVCMCFFG
ncbi:hypothetical protein B0J13DRAFT_552243 [Dactylonectria estremocensis]|uniref:Transmembrane protein n=1 Tax=Dactylonectria estremocensis TaxID=1079267 RepID=A0A9P9F0S6_9HYPO|nr:hypothetical protein B0J13DRAFT_552243 [Dactylonectria estremocensis]